MIDPCIALMSFGFLTNPIITCLVRIFFTKSLKKKVQYEQMNTNFNLAEGVCNQIYTGSCFWDHQPILPGMILDGADPVLSRRVGLDGLLKSLVGILFYDSTLGATDSTKLQV